MSAPSSTALAAVVAAADETLRPHAVPDPGEGEFERRVPDGDRAFVLEAVREGYLLHYDEPRAFDGMDPDLRLLAGDALYALGLARLAATGDLPAVAELADLISLCAWAESEGRRDVVPALWDASVTALTEGGPGARSVRNGRVPPAS
ncbi:MAG: hypothetical protein QOD53_1326 [Thermoleophilaceae bacterium]|nr:hypothetical protein [Thermoleophilaceae bacterium]